MPSRHHLLAELEEKRHKNKKEPVEVLAWDYVERTEATGYNPYDNPGTGKPKALAVKQGRPNKRRKLFR